MSLVVNHNMMAAHSSRILNSHYRKLSDSTRKLSSGLRVETAADDAAGLAIRELMRAEISTLNQGVRNANDAISLIQTADGAMQVIDEKLIRMKELAEQAATGTYDSTQRLIIESEYQQMASEITRIANATDFNNIKLLDGNLSSSQHDGSGLNSTGKLKVHFGTGNDSAEDYYYIKIDECTAEAFSLGNGATFEMSAQKYAEAMRGAFAEAFQGKLERGEISQTQFDALQELGGMLAADVLGNGTPGNIGSFIHSYWGLYPGSFWENGVASTPDKFHPDPNEIPVQDHDREGYNIPQLEGDTIEEKYVSYQAMTEEERQKLKYIWGRQEAKWQGQNYNAGWDGTPANTFYPPYPKDSTMEEALQQKFAFIGYDGTIGQDNDKYPDTQITVTESEIQAAVSSAASWYLKRHTYAGKNIATQENAQIALDAIDQAIEIKDNIRANLGAMQNRLENTITNLEIQAENLQAAESQISDVDVASEMTNFVRNQILVQSGVAMLSQANSLPQMAMQLIGG